MTWLLLLSLAAEPLDDVAPLHVGPARTTASARTTQTLQGSDCTFEKREVADPLVDWQWVARCPAQDVRAVSVGAQVGVRLFTQQSHSTLLVFDGTRAVEVQELSASTAAPPWVSRPLLANLQTQYRELSSVLAHDARDGSLAVHEWNRGYERVTPSTAPTGPTRTPLFERAPPPETPVLSMWFARTAREPWVFYADDPWRRVEFSLRAPGGETRQLFTRPARATGGNYRVEALTHLTTDAGEVFSVMVDHRHLVLWPRSDGSFLPRVAGVAMPGQTPVLAQRSAPPCVERTETRREETVNAPRLFLRGKQLWATWLTGTIDTRWHVGPVLNFDAKDERTCEWILDGQEGHVAVTLGRFTADGQLEEQLRLPSAGAPDHLELTSSERGVTLVVVANGELTVTHLKP